jgi:hypothetical protein
MASLFSSSEYTDSVLVCGEALGCSASLENFRATSCGGVHEGLDTIEVLRKRVENAVATICNNRRMLENVEESFRQRLHYCIDNNGGHFEHFL